MRIRNTQVAALFAAGVAAAAPAVAQEAQDFCRIGFAGGETATDAVLSMTEIEGMRGREFAVLDADGDGKLTSEEYGACLTEGMSAEILPRNVSPTGSGDLEETGLRVELQPLKEGGALSRADFMAEAERAFNGTGNEEDNQLEWARAFIVMLPEEDQIDVRTIGRGEFAARSAMLFRRLDKDGNGELTSAEWMGEGGAGDAAAGAEDAFATLDGDGSGEVTAEEYAAAGSARARATLDEARAAGWEDNGEQEAGIGTEEEPGEVVSTSSEGLVEEGTETPPADATAAAEPPMPQPSAEGRDRVPAFFYFFHE
jgi:Ca2+-binding EF-hand superfamily protein